MTACSTIVLLGLPASKEEFAQRAQQPFWDWGRNFGVTPDDWENAYYKVYAEAVPAVQSLLANSVLHHYSVISAATLANLELSLKTAHVVIVFAHWRGCTIHDWDLLEGWEEHAVRLANLPQNPIGNLIRPLVQNKTLGKEKLVGELNHSIEKNWLLNFLPVGITNNVDTDTGILRTLARDLIDHSFAGFLRPGNGLELFDGIHRPAVIEQALPEDFTGTLDLSCCTSSILSAYLRLGRKQPIDIISGSEELIPLPQIRIIEWALIETARSGEEYRDIRLECSRLAHDYFIKNQKG